jgi:hypothetical protein
MVTRLTSGSFDCAFPPASVGLAQDDRKLVGFVSVVVSS